MRQTYVVEFICEDNSKHVAALFLNKPVYPGEDPVKHYEGKSFIYAEDGADYSGMSLIGVWRSNKPMTLKARNDTVAIRKFKRHMHRLREALKHAPEYYCGL